MPEKKIPPGMGEKKSRIRNTPIILEKNISIFTFSPKFQENSHLSLIAINALFTLA